MVWRYNHRKPQALPPFSFSRRQAQLLPFSSQPKCCVGMAEHSVPFNDPQNATTKASRSRFDRGRWGACPCGPSPNKRFPLASRITTVLPALSAVRPLASLVICLCYQMASVTSTRQTSIIYTGLTSVAFFPSDPSFALPFSGLYILTLALILWITWA